MTVSANNLNCYLHCIRDLLIHHQKDDLINTLVQPLGFGFEVELTSREWWIGTQTECDFFDLTFNRGLVVRWEEQSPELFIEYFQNEINNGKVVILQTEWSKVPYHPHYQSRINDIHTIMVLDYNKDEKKIKILDRMAPNFLNFDYKMQGWVDLDSFKDAFSDRLTVLKYGFNQPVDNFDSELLVILKKSISNMRNRKMEYRPHLQIAYGLNGIKLFKESLSTFNPKFRCDKQNLFLLGERFPNCISNHLVGNKILLVKALMKSNIQNSNKLSDEIYITINYWKKFREQLIWVTSKKNTDYTTILNTLDSIIYQEEKVIELLEKEFC